MTGWKRSKSRRDFITWLAKGGAALAVALFLKPGWLEAHGESQPLGSRLAENKYSTLFEKLEHQHGFSRKELKRLFSKARVHLEIPRFFRKPPEALPYHEYRQRHITPKSVSRGRQFLKQHRAVFDRVEETYDVDTLIIAGILGVETKFGLHSRGRFRVFDALNTIFSEIPRREAFARRELIEFLLLCREEKLDPVKVEGSYAGAMGMPQFIPSSYRAYSVDFDGDGRRDLWKSTEDIIGSVAHYLRHFGWEKGGAIMIPVTTPLKDPAVRRLADQGLKQKTSIEELKTQGVVLASGSQDLDPGENVSLISFEGERKEEVAAVFSNFRTILKYNNAVSYAMAVSDLGTALNQT